MLYIHGNCIRIRLNYSSLINMRTHREMSILAFPTLNSFASVDVNVNTANCR